MNIVVLLDGVRAALDRVRWWIMRVAPSRKRRREAAEKSGRTDSGWRGCEAEAEARRVEKGQRKADCQRGRGIPVVGRTVAK